MIDRHACMLAKMMELRMESAKVELAFTLCPACAPHILHDGGKLSDMLSCDVTHGVVLARDKKHRKVPQVLQRYHFVCSSSAWSRMIDTVHMHVPTSKETGWAHQLTPCIRLRSISS